MSGLGSVQIHHVQATDAMIFKLLGYFQGIFIIDLPGLIISLRQTDAFPFYHVYGWYQFNHTFTD